METTSNFSLIHRLLHWVLAISMCIVLTTALLRMGWMEKHHMADILLAALAKLNVTITQDQAVVIAKSIRNVMFKWHHYAGYVLAASLVLRFIYTRKSGWKHAKLTDKQATIKQKSQSILYVAFYICTVIVTVTGLSMVFCHDITPGFFKTIHKAALWYLIPFMALHFIGMLLEDYRKADKSVISKMFFG